MKKKIFITIFVIFCFVTLGLYAQPAPRCHRSRPAPDSSQILTPKHRPHYHHRRPLPPPGPRICFRVTRPVTVYRSTSRVYRDPPPVRRDLPLRSAVEYEYVYDCDYDCPIRGTIKAIDPSTGTLVVDSDGETLIVSASASTKVFKDNDDPKNNRYPKGVISIGIGDVCKGDFVGIQVTDNGEVTLSASIVHVFDLTR